MDNSTTSQSSPLIPQRESSNETPKYKTASSIKKDSSGSKTSLPDLLNKTKRFYKYTVPNDLKSKIKENKTLENDPIIHSPEFQFLYKLFVPSKILMKNEQVSSKQLLNHLPTIITGDRSANREQLNFQVHLFLATIIDKYVSSWYLTKLNTDNYEFLSSTYMVMCDFLKDFYKRIYETFKDSNYINIFSDICDIMTTHLENLVSNRNDKYKIKILNDFFMNSSCKNTTQNENIEVSSIIDKFLEENHVIFESTSSFVQKLDGLNLNEVMYYRMLAKSILITSNEINENNLSSIVNSPIVLNLAVVLIGDMVFRKIIDKISSPEFFLGLINDIFKSLGSKLDSKESLQDKTPEESNFPLRQKIKNIFTKSYTNMSYLVVYSYKISEEDSDSNLSTLTDSFFRLMDAITGFSERRVLLTGILNFVRKSIFSSKHINSKVNVIGKNYIANKLNTSRILSDTNLAKILSNLRESVFNDGNQEEEIEKKNPTIEDIVDNIFEVLNYRIPSTLSMKYGSNIYRYTDESDDDIKESINRLLVIFNYSESSTDENEINKQSKLNKLLVIRIMDYLFSQFYPELVI